VKLSLTGRVNNLRESWSSSATYTYGWDDGFTVGATIPLELFEASINPLTTQTPRINGRVTVQTQYRVWGDALEYVGFELGLGLPWQTDPALRKTTNATWAGILAVFGRWDLGNVALRGTISDQPFFPEENDVGTTQVFRDQGNAVNFTVSADFFTRTRYSPFVQFSYSPPAGTETGTIGSAGNPLLDVTGETSQGRTVSVGINFAPLRYKFVFTLEGDYLWMPGAPIASPFQGTGRVRWVF
jgi:hypothetical protein